MASRAPYIERPTYTTRIAATTMAMIFIKRAFFMIFIGAKGA
ncbi:hypothetical protein ES703_79100 [subsurface metagenome]